MQDDIEVKALGKIKEAMSDVIQELLLIDKAGVSHLVYIHRLYWDNGLKVEFSTPEEDKEALIPLVMEAMQAQIQNSDIPRPAPPTRWEKFKETVIGIMKSYF